MDDRRCSAVGSSGGDLCGIAYLDGRKGEAVKFCDAPWGPQCEPSIPQVVAAAYLEARGFLFGVHFDLKNVVELAENLYAAEMELEKTQ